MKVFVAEQSIFVENVEKMEFCKKTLSEEDYKQFVYAVRNNYWYQMYLDELPMFGKCFSWSDFVQMIAV